MWPDTQWITIPGQVTLFRSPSRSLNPAVNKLISSNTRKSHTGWTFPVVEQSANRSNCVASNSFCLMAVSVPLIIAGCSPGQWSTALLLISHHWTQVQSLESERSCITLLKLGSASTKAWHLLEPKGNSHSQPPLSHRGVITLIIWGYSTHPTRLAPAQVHQQVQGGSIWP